MEQKGRSAVPGSCIDRGSLRQQCPNDIDLALGHRQHQSRPTILGPGVYLETLVGEKELRNISVALTYGHEQGRPPARSDVL